MCGAGKSGVTYQLGPKATDKDVWRSEAGVISKVTEQLTSEKVKKLVAEVLFFN